jgi:nucleoside-diphosphate-sugar epimerase
MRILLFGGTGLIGRVTAQQLRADGCDVAVAGRTAGAGDVSGTRSYALDITRRDDVNAVTADWKPEVIVQLAACLQSDCDRDPARAVATNIDGHLNVLEAACAHGVRRMVFGSSIAAYGQRKGQLCEGEPPSADTTVYGQTKWIGERLEDLYARKAGLEFVALRYSGVFGSGPVHGAGMALTRAELLRTVSNEGVVLDYVSGEEVCHLTHVDDAAAATRAAVIRPKLRWSLYNVAGPDENVVSLKAFHDAIRAVEPGAGEAEFQGIGRSAGRVDTMRMRTDLGSLFHYNIEQGIRRTLYGALA